MPTTTQHCPSSPNENISPGVPGHTNIMATFCHGLGHSPVSNRICSPCLSSGITDNRETPGNSRQLSGVCPQSGAYLRQTAEQASADGAQKSSCCQTVSYVTAHCSETNFVGVGSTWMFGAIKVLGFEKSAPWSRISSLLALTSLLSVTQAVPSGDTTTTAPSAATVTGSPTPSPAAATSSSTSSGLSAGVQAGIALGVVIPILLLAIGSVYFIRRRKRNQSQGARSGRRPTIPDYESFSAIEGLPHNFPIFPVTANIPVELKGNSTRRPAEQQARPKHERSDSQAPLARDWKPLDVESPASYTYDESPTSASPSKYERSGSKSSHVPWKPMEPPAVHKQERSAGYKRGRAGSTKIPMGRRWNPEELDRRIRLEDANEDLFG